MPIADLQRRDTEVGRIRLGVKKGGRADRLDTFRFTSADQAMIEEIAALYGGEARPWQNDKKRQFEVITETSIIPVYIPPQIVDPWYEQWGNGVCQRRCDGIRDTVHDRPCDCSTDPRGKKSKCKPTTRVNLYLAEVAGMGVWRLETHGIYAAGEMVQMSERINGIRIPLPARLMLEQRGGKRFDREKQKVETLDYNVPVLLLDSVTSRHVALGGDAVTQVVRAAASQAIGAAEPMPALGAAPATPPPPDPEMVRRALAQIATATPEQMADLDQRIKKVGSPPELLAAFQARLAEHELARKRLAAAGEWVAAPSDEPSQAEQVLERLRTAAPDEMDGLRAEIVDLGSPELLVAAWRHRQAAHQQEAERRAEGPWDTEDPQTAPAAPPAAPEPPEPPAPTGMPPAAPVATEAPGDRQAAMTRLLVAAGAKDIKRAELDTRMRSDHEVSLKTASAEQLDALAAAL